MTGEASTGRLQVFFVDDREPLIYTVTPRVILEIERRWPGRNIDRTDAAPSWESTLYGAWVASGRPEDFETFVDDIDRIESVNGHADAASETDPTNPAVSDAT